MYDEFNAQETLPKPDKNAPQGTFAVKGTSFRVKKGEVFTLLGVNGAGKSTTFKCLVGLEPISSGNVILNGDINLNDTFGSPELLHGVVGYCPQTDCIAP
jgi:ABC-type multidrug transport system ATPase subunit